MLANNVEGFRVSNMSRAVRSDRRQMDQLLVEVEEELERITVVVSRLEVVTGVSQCKGLHQSLNRLA